MSVVHTTRSVVLCYGSSSKLMQGWELSSRKPNRSSITKVQSRLKAKTKIQSRISPGDERLGNHWKLFLNLENQCFSFSLFLSFFFNALNAAVGSIINLLKNSPNLLIAGEKVTGWFFCKSSYAPFTAMFILACQAKGR